MTTGDNHIENDYLWDGSGEPDPEIQKLEALLGEYRHDSPAPVFPEIVPDRRWTFFPLRMRLFPALAATTAAAVLAIAIEVPLVASVSRVTRSCWALHRGRPLAAGRSVGAVSCGSGAGGW